MRLGLAAVLAGSLAWLYADAGRGLVVQWITSPDASYGAILAGVALLVFWQRRHRIFGEHGQSRASIAGIAVAAVGLVAHLAGLFAADLFTTRASFVVVAGGLIWFFGGSRAAAAAFTPLAFLVLAIPLPELVVTTATSSLQAIAAATAELTLTAGGIPVYRDGNVLELPAATLQIAEACSGLRSVVSLASVGVLLAWATPGSPMQRTLLVLSTLPIAVVANGLRVAGTGAAAEAWGPAMTKDPWHSLAGWVTFVVSLTALWAVRRALTARQSLLRPALVRA
jgi:exosortase